MGTRRQLGCRTIAALAVALTLLGCGTRTGLASREPRPDAEPARDAGRDAAPPKDAASEPERCATSDPFVVATLEGEVDALAGAMGDSGRVLLAAHVVSEDPRGRIAALLLTPEGELRSGPHDVGPVFAPDVRASWVPSRGRYALVMAGPSDVQLAWVTPGGTVEERVSTGVIASVPTALSAAGGRLLVGGGPIRGDDGILRTRVRLLSTDRAPLPLGEAVLAGRVTTAIRSEAVPGAFVVCSLDTHSAVLHRIAADGESRSLDRFERHDLVLRHAAAVPDRGDGGLVWLAERGSVTDMMIGLEHEGRRRTWDRFGQHVGAVDAAREGRGWTVAAGFGVLSDAGGPHREARISVLAGRGPREARAEVAAAPTAAEPAAVVVVGAAEHALVLWPGMPEPGDETAIYGLRVICPG